MNIIMTIGPASDSPEMINRLSRSAAGFRLNSSFMTPQSICDIIGIIRQYSVKPDIPVFIDLQGAKMRIGMIQPMESLPAELSLIYSKESTDPSRIPVPWKPLFDECRPGDILTLNDRRVKLEVIKPGVEKILARVIRNGPLSNYKGINREAHPIPFKGLTNKDKEIIRATTALASLEYALSFVFTGEEADHVRALTNRPVVAKIERPECFSYLENIDSTFDSLWLCRGDLGAQGGLDRLPALQNQFEEMIPEFSNNAFLAGQVLEYMTHFPEPTRSEVVHLYNSLNRGFSGIVLSDETAIGRNPGRVADFLDRLGSLV